MISAYEWGLKHRSCEEALEVRKELGNSVTQKQFYERYCERGDWLLWQLMQVPEDRLGGYLKQFVNISRKITDSASYLAYAAYAYDAHAAYNAASYAAYDAYAAAYSVADYVIRCPYGIDHHQGAKELRLQADYVRSEIPEWVFD